MFTVEICWHYFRLAYSKIAIIRRRREQRHTQGFCTWLHPCISSRSQVMKANEAGVSADTILILLSEKCPVLIIFASAYLHIKVELLALAEIWTLPVSFLFTLKLELISNWQVSILEYQYHLRISIEQQQKRQKKTTWS